MAEQLADLIEANPICQFDIDNDMWYMAKPRNDNDLDDEDDDVLTEDITNSDEMSWSTDWYGHSDTYGSGIAEALVILLNRRGFQIKASAV